MRLFRRLLRENLKEDEHGMSPVEHSIKES